MSTVTLPGARGAERTRSGLDRALTIALALLAAASLVGVPMAAATIPDGPARLQLLAWTGALAALLAIPSARLRVADWIGPAAARHAASAQVVLVVLLVGVVAAVQALVFQGMPQFPDSFAELFQARILAAGRLWLPAPVRPDLLRIANLVDAGGRFYAQYPIGNPALLALGLVTGIGFLPAAVIAFGLGTGVRALARECASEAATALALLLALASSMLVLSAAGGMSQATTAALGAWALALALRARRHAGGSVPAGAAVLDDPRPARHPSGVPAAVGSGLAVGLAAAVRPLDAVVLALVALPVVAAAASGSRLRRLVAWLLAAAVGVLPLLVANALTTGSAFRLGYAVLWGAGTLPGFGLRGWGVRFGPADGLQATLVDLGGLNLALLEWPVPVLVALAAVVAARRPLPFGQRVLTAYLFAHVATYFTYWHHDFFYGPRFLLPVVPVVLVLLADGLVRFGRRAAAAASPPPVALAGVDPSAPAPTAARGTARAPARAGARAAMLAFVRELLFVQLLFSAVLVAWPRLARAGRWDLAAAAAIRDAAITTGRPRAALLVDDGFGSRLFGQMWRLGVSAPAAERFYAAADACRLQDAIRRTELDGRRDHAAEAELADLLAGATPGVPYGHYPARYLRLPPGPLPAECAEQVSYDRERLRTPFAPLLWLNDPDGRGIVFWRDPGPARLAWLLRTADRPLYRVRVRPAGPGAFDVALEPLTAPGPLRLR